MHIAFEDLKVASIFRFASFKCTNTPPLALPQDLEIFHKLMDTNYFGYVYTTHFALPYLRKSPHPRIVVISSLSGRASSERLTLLFHFPSGLIPLLLV